MNENLKCNPFDFERWHNYVFFVIEQFKGVVLTKNENTILSIFYLITGISLVILARKKFLEKKNE